MVTKSAEKKLKKYSGIAENVKSVKNNTENKQKPEIKEEEPLITMEQVISAFKSFGLEPNERNQNDIGYWTTRPQSEGPKLMEELRSRRSEMNSEEDEIGKTKQTMPRLSDQDLLSLFDEYGLPAPDPEFARNNLPNDPQKIRNILEVQRKNMDDMMKVEAKNKVQQASQQPMQAPPMQQPMQSPVGGLGGPTQQAPGQEPIMGENMTPFFVGDVALIKLLNANNPNTGTLWLADKKKKILRPIKNEAMIDSIFENPEEAKNSITTVSSNALSPTGVLSDFSLLDQSKGIQDDGSMEDIPFSKAQLKNRYGKEKNPEAEQKAMSILDGFIGNLNNKQ